MARLNRMLGITFIALLIFGSQQFYAAAFQRGYSGSRAGISVVAMRVIRRDVIIVDGTWFIENARTPGGAIAPREEGVATLVAVKAPGGWRVSAVREQTSATAIHDMQGP
jgi:hypothetical protein